MCLSTNSIFIHQIHKEKVHDKTLQRVQEYWLTVMKERRSSENSYHDQHRDTRLYNGLFIRFISVREVFPIRSIGNGSSSRQWHTAVFRFHRSTATSTVLRQTGL